MDNWKKSLDRYLTTEPDNGFDSWCENVVEEIIKINPNWDKDGLFIDSEDGNKLLNRFHLEGKNPSEAAKLIYNLNPEK